MFKSEPMQRVRVYSDKAKVTNVVSALYEFGAIHVTPVKHGFLQEYGQTLETFKDVSTALIAIRSAEKILTLKAESQQVSGTLENLLAQCKGAGVYEVITLNEAREKALQTKLNLQRKIDELMPFAAFELDAKITQLKSVEFSVFQTTANQVAIREEVKQIGNSAATFVKIGSLDYCLLVCDKLVGEKAAKLVSRYAVKTFSTPQISEKSFEAGVKTLRIELTKAEEEVSAIENKLAQIRDKNGALIMGLKNALELESKKAQLPFAFGSTYSLVAVEGWVPKKIASEMEQMLNKKLKQVYVELLKTKELPPTKQRNPRPINSFEELVKFFSLPKSTELDPTPLVAVSFPLFFGMIVGDIGYGLVSLLAAIMLKTKFQDKFMQSLATMLAVSSVSSIIFGFIFAEFFGFENILGIELHPIIHRISPEGLASLMALCILFGMLHLAIGYIIGAYQAFVHHHAKHAYAKISWLVLEFSLALFIAGNLKVSFLQFIEPAAQLVPPAITGPLVLLSVIGIGVFEGATALFEIPGLLSNIFSYLRIMALGVSGVVIALILNKLPESVSFATPLGIITSILLLVLYVLGHLAGIGLALFESMIQSMRLQYVEFFSKFFEGGGIQFTPLKQ